jgi:tRNA1Val (adenine37-N6)-methyltransferase
MFRFKQFTVDQSGCAMKINTDGVLLGAIAEASEPKLILDIGTGTGVIALMLAQRYEAAQIDAIEIDEEAQKTAGKNFENSPFADRLKAFSTGFESYFEQFPERQYDLIVSNPPFYIDSLKSPGLKKNLAKHTNVDFFETLLKGVAAQLSSDGVFWLILPDTLFDVMIEIAEVESLLLLKMINIKSYQHYDAHRVIVCFSFHKGLPEISNFTIYKERSIYSDDYQTLLQPYFLAF